MTALTWCFAPLWETIADAIPEATALIHGETETAWRDYDARAARLASVLAAAGLTLDSKAALYAHNSPAYLEAQFAIFKVRAVPVNVNYRYTESELLYLLDNADAEALIFDAQFGERVTAIRQALPKLRLLIEIEDGSGQHLEGALRLEEAIAGAESLPRRIHDEADLYMLYTGGTTGMPKGVMYRQGEFNRGLSGGFSAMGMELPETPQALAAMVRTIREQSLAPVSLAACPLMHGTGLWLGVFAAHILGGTAVTLPGAHFDPDALWREVERRRITSVAVVGDAFAKPLLAALERASAEGRPYDLSSLRQIVSSGVMFSREVKEGLLGFADIAILDAMGSSEGAMGFSAVSRAAPPAATARFERYEGTKVFNDRDEEVAPGSDEIGMIANGGFMPVGYYKDAEKTARTFRTIRGQRYSFPGDFAKVAADGSLILLGRGSVCINTGGEKVFPEEVEEALKAHPDVFDCLVVGLPDPRFGEAVTAVLALRDGRSAAEADLIAFARARIAGYKLPRRIVVVDAVRRAANGKADYPWARQTAAAAPDMQKETKA